MSIFYGYDIDTLLLYGGTMVRDITMGDNSIFNVKELTFSNTLDSIDLNNKQLKKLAAPTDPQDAVSKGYTDANFLQLSGGTMVGNIAMNNGIISDIKSLTFSDTFDGVNLNNKQLKQLGDPTDPRDAASKNYTDTNFLQLSGGTMTGPITLHSNPTEDFHPCTKQFTEGLVRKSRKVELVYREWNYKAIGRTRLRYSGESIMIGNTLSESSDAALNIVAISFYTSSTSYKGQSIKLLLSLKYVARDGARGTADLGTVVLNTWRHNPRSYGGLLTSQVNKEYNLHKTLTKVVTTSIRSFDIGVRHGQGGSDLPSGECLLLVSLSDMV